MKFGGNSGSSNSRPTSRPTLKIGVDFGGGGKSAAPKPDTSIGKGSFDFGNALGSIGETAGNFKDFATGLVGGIGIPGGPNLGDVAKLPGGAVDAIGGITLPYLGNDPTRQAAKLGDVPGAVGGALGFLGKQVEGGVAAERLNAQQQGRGSLLGDILNFDPMRAGAAARSAITGEQTPVEITNDLPPEFQARLDAGESVDKLAKEMADAGVGYSSDAFRQFSSSILLDPLNLILPGVGRAGTIARQADRALKAGDSLGVGRFFMAKAYDAGSRGLSAGGQALTDAVLGPTTSGVFHALGTRPYQAIRSGLSKLTPQYGQSFDDALAVGSGQLPRAVIVREMAHDLAADLKRRGQAALKGLDNAESSLEARMTAQRTLNADELQRGTEELLARVTPDFAGRSAASIADETVRKLALITDASPEDAARVLGKHAGDLRTARTVHLATYGKAVQDFGPARARAATAKNIDAERLTIVGPENMTEERALAALASPEALSDAVERYSVLANRFEGTAYDHAEVRAFIQKLLDEDALTKAVKLPVTGKNALPVALRSWRAKYRDVGYDLGYMPKGGVKTIIDPDTGDVIYAELFVGVTTEADPLTMRNPLGRFMDGMFRGITQTAIIQDSKARFVAVTRDTGISPGEARGLHKIVLEEARRQGTTPRALDNYAEMFERYLGPERYAKLAAVHDPSFLVMKSFEGNLSRVGLTQKISGKAKTASSERGNHVALIAEKIYPTIKYVLSPLFQLSELVESKVWNTLRGVLPHPASPEIASLYKELAELPEVRHFTEAGYFLHLWGADAVAKTMGVDTLLGKALSRVPNVADSKHRAQALQIMTEHPEAFENAVNTINPKFWKAMTEAYGTTDARAVTHRFVSERFDMMDPAAAVRQFDAVMPRTFASADEETVWQAFRESIRATSQRAFKTHYFNPRRGWLERSINHQYLGLYPLSYMAKVYSEFARFLLFRPFGLKAPLLGAVAYSHVQEALAARMASDPDFAKAVDDNADLIYAFAVIMPAFPNDLPANTPAWSRHLAQDVTSKKKIDPQRFVVREGQDAATYAFGPTRTADVALGALGDLGDLAGDLFKRLDNAAFQLDAAYPRR